MDSLKNGRINAGYIRAKNYNDDLVRTQVSSVIDKIFARVKSTSEVVTLYVDCDKLGLGNVTALEQLKSDIAAGKIDTLYITDIARISHNVEKIHAFLDLTKSHDVNVVMTK